MRRDETLLSAARARVEATNVTDLESLRDQLRAFAAARDWDRFHSPKNLAMALSAEAGELLRGVPVADRDAEPQPSSRCTRRRQAKKSRMSCFT